jgi:uncharacterized protein YjiS (DUF1127 family)
MASIRIISSQMSDYELSDIGIRRCDIDSIARETVAA